MNRRAFIRRFAGGAAAVCGIPLLRSKAKTGAMRAPDVYFNGVPIWWQPSPFPPLSSADEKNELLRKMVTFRRAELKAIWDKKTGDIIEEALWGQLSDRPASPESVVMGQLFADKKIRIIGGSEIKRIKT